MERDLLCLDLPVLDIDLVAYQTDRDVGTDSGEIFVPLRDVFVCDS